MTRRAWTAVALVAAAAAGCRGAAPDAHAEMTATLMAHYEPLATCVTSALATRRDFDGNLGAFIVDSGQDVQLQAISQRYLGTTAEPAEGDRPTRVAAANTTMQALARYAGEPAEGPGRVRRTMALVEGMSLTAFATGIDCAPSEALQQTMMSAEQAYPASREAPATP